jgi:hypothetical protein
MWQVFWSELLSLSTVPVSILFVSCALCALYWRSLGGAWRIFAAYLWFTLGIELAARVAAVLWQQNLPLLHLYTLGEFALFALFFRSIMAEKAWLRRYTPWVLGLGLGLILLNTLFLQGIFSFNSYAKTGVQVLLIAWATEFAFNPGPVGLPEKAALRQLNTGILVYYCGSLFIFMFSEIARRTGDALHILWDINVVLYVIFNAIVLHSLWRVIFNPSKSPTSSA